LVPIEIEILFADVKKAKISRVLKTPSDALATTYNTEGGVKLMVANVPTSIEVPYLTCSDTGQGDSETANDPAAAQFAAPAALVPQTDITRTIAVRILRKRATITNP
jgi:hypothetical protein